MIPGITHVYTMDIAIKTVVFVSVIMDTLDQIAPKFRLVSMTLLVMKDTALATAMKKVANVSVIMVQQQEHIAKRLPRAGTTMLAIAMGNAMWQAQHASVLLELVDSFVSPFLMVFTKLGAMTHGKTSRQKCSGVTFLVVTIGSALTFPVLAVGNGGDPDVLSWITLR